MDDAAKAIKTPVEAAAAAAISRNDAANASKEMHPITEAIVDSDMSASVPVVDDKPNNTTDSQETNDDLLAFLDGDTAADSAAVVDGQPNDV